MNRTLTVLTAAASVAQTGAPIVVLLGGIVGASMAPVPGLATLPVALMIVGTAMSTIPASLLMRRVGRKVGFIFAAAYSAGGGGSPLAIINGWFWMLCVATFLIGSHNAFVQQYRFAVAESASPDRLVGHYPFSCWRVCSGVHWTENGDRTPICDCSALYAGSFLGLSALMICAMGVLTMYVPTTPKSAQQEGRDDRF